MKKLVVLLVILLLCVAGWAGATYFVGVQTKAKYVDLVEQHGKLGPITISVKDYQRNFRDAKAHTVVEMKVPTGELAADGKTPEMEALRLVFEETIHHGPLLDSGFGLATSESRLVEVSPGQEEFDRLLKEVPALAGVLSVSRVDFNGTVHSTVTVPAIHSVSDAGEGELSWGGLKLESTYSPGSKSVVGDFDCARLEGKLPRGIFNWDGMQGSFDLVEALPLLYVGKSRATIGRLNLDAPNAGGGREQVDFKGIKVISDSRLQAGMLNLEQTLSFDGMSVQGENYGPGELEIEMANLDGVVLSDFQRQIYDFYGSANYADPEALMATMLPLYTQLVTQLLEKSPQFNIRKLQFTTPKGEISGKLQFSYDGSQGFNPAATDALLRAINAQAELTLHENLVKSMLAGQLLDQLQAARMLGQLPETITDAELEQIASEQVDGQLEAVLAQNLVVRDGELIRSRASLSKGELTVNGQNLPLFQ